MTWNCTVPLVVITITTSGGLQMIGKLNTQPQQLNCHEQYWSKRSQACTLTLLLNYEAKCGCFPKHGQWRGVMKSNGDLQPIASTGYYPEICTLPQLGSNLIYSKVIDVSKPLCMCHVT